MTALYLLRHGQSEWNAARRLQGATEVPLNDVGRAQAESVAQQLVGEFASAPYVVSSDLSRASDTADAVGTALGATPVLDERLRERSFGVWEGTTEEERLASDPDDIARWYRGETPRIAGFEDTQTLAERLIAATDHALADAGDRDVLVVSHGSALRVLVNALLGLPVAARPLGGLDNAHWSVVTPQRDGGWTLARHNVGRD